MNSQHIPFHNVNLSQDSIQEDPNFSSVFSPNSGFTFFLHKFNMAFLSEKAFPSTCTRMCI